MVEPAVRVRPGRRRVLDRVSSMMPNKKNPDPAELVRGRAARVIGALTGDPRAAQGPAAGLPARPPGGQGAAVRRGRGLRGLARGAWPGWSTRSTVDRERMRAAAAEGYTTATAVADALVRRGVPFRAAHHVVGALVAQAEAAGVGLDAVPDGDDRAGARGERRPSGRRPGRRSRGSATRSARPRSLDGALASCDVIGGTAPGRVADGPRGRPGAAPRRGLTVARSPSRSRPAATRRGP